MLDSSSRLQCVAPLSPHDGRDWEEATFTRPMRSPFSARRTKTPARTVAEVDVRLEESALFDAPPKLVDEETTQKSNVHPGLLRAIRERDSVRMRQAIYAVEVLDLAKTMEEPVLDVCEEFLEASAVRSSE